MSLLDRLLGGSLPDETVDPGKFVTELSDVHLDEVSIVSSPATGRRFKLFKSLGIGAAVTGRSDGRDVRTHRPASELLRSLTAGG